MVFHVAMDKYILYQSQYDFWGWKIQTSTLSQINAPLISGRQDLSLVDKQHKIVNTNSTMKKESILLASPVENKTPQSLAMSDSIAC